MVELNESAINTRARLANALALILEADPRVLRWRRVEFAEDGGVVVLVDLLPGQDRIARQVIARELEFAVGRALPRIPWIRVQVA
jgi:hypothetical protein